MIEVKVSQINFPQINTEMMMNGLSSAPLTSGDVKYPPNVGRGLSSAELDVDKLYEPKQNKKIVRLPLTFQPERSQNLSL